MSVVAISCDQALTSEANPMASVVRLSQRPSAVGVVASVVRIRSSVKSERAVRSNSVTLDLLVSHPRVLHAPIPALQNYESGPLHS
jgi:hypothetical protein